MDKNTKQELKRIWCERSVIGLLGLAALGFFIAKIPTVYEQMQAQAQYDPVLAQYDQALAQYDQALAPAKAQYNRAQAQAQAQYDRALAPAQAQYNRTQAQAQAQYDRAQAPALAQYEQALTPAQMQYDRALAPVQYYRALAQYLRTLPLAEYNRALAQYDRALAPAKAQYDRALAPAQAQYDRALAPAQAQYDRALAPAQAQYDRAQVQAQAQYDRAQALARAPAPGRSTALQSQFMLLGISALCFILMLLLLLRRNQISLPLTGQLIIVLPEECIADLEDLHQQIKSKERSVWVIRSTMLWSVLGLLWAFYVQINFENLWLPKSKGRNKIDD